MTKNWSKLLDFYMIMVSHQYTVHGKNLEWERLVNLVNIKPFTNSLPANYFSVIAIHAAHSPNILPSSWFRLAHSPIFYLVKIFPCMVCLFFYYCSVLFFKVRWCTMRTHF